MELANWKTLFLKKWQNIGVIAGTQNVLNTIKRETAETKLHME